MSSSITPKVEPGTAETTAESITARSTLDNQVLRIDTANEVGHLPRRLVSLHGCPPRELRWHNFAHTYPDVRTRGALTIQYKAKQQDDLLTNHVAQDSLRRGLWPRLMEMLEEEKLPNEPPIITFGEWDSTKAQPLTVINMVFSSHRAFQCIRTKLREIALGGKEGTEHQYAKVWSANNLSGDTFLIDCLDLPIKGIDVNSLFSSLTSMTRELGLLLGISKIVVDIENTDIVAETGTVRGYLRLARPFLTVPLRDLATELPSHFVWHGVPHRLLYTGYDLDPEPRFSVDYPLSPGSASSSTSEASGALKDNGQSNASSGTSKKRKASEK